MQNCYTAKLNTKNLYYTKLLKELYYGSYGENFCLIQFLIYSSELSNFENEITILMEKIAKDEFVHLKKIGDLIIQFGGELENNNLANNYIFSKNIKEIVKNTIKIKENCLINYKIIRNKISNSVINKELQQIILDEQKHLELLKNLFKLINN